VASTTDYVQLAIEQTPRYEGATGVTGSLQVSTNVVYMPVQNVVVNPAPTFLDRSDELRAIDGGVAQAVDMFNPTGSIAVRAYADLIPYLLNCAGFTGVATQGDGSTVKDPDGTAIPTTAYRWVFTKRTGLTAKSMQLILAYFSEGVYLKGNGFGLTSYSQNSAGDITADMLGLVVSRIADPSLTASLLAPGLVNFRRGDITLTWLSGTATSDDFSFTIANELTQRHSFGLTTPSYFPDKLEHGDARVRVTGTIPKSVIDVDDYDALINGTTFAATAKWSSPIKVGGATGATATNYRMYLEMPACQYLAGTPDPLHNVRRRGASFDWWASIDPTLGYDAKITLVNAVSAIETYPL
jgi:hypothetical protein